MPDILIRMEMPGHCFNCSTKIDPDNRKCNIDGHVFEETLSKLTCRRDENCPLHELPPHGDLVDATQYRDEFMDGVYNMCADDPDNNRANVIIDLYDCAPVIVPSEKGETQ